MPEVGLFQAELDKWLEEVERSGERFLSAEERLRRSSGIQASGEARESVPWYLSVAKFFGQIVPGGRVVRPPIREPESREGLIQAALQATQPVDEVEKAVRAYYISQGVGLPAQERLAVFMAGKQLETANWWVDFYQVVPALILTGEVASFEDFANMRVDYAGVVTASMEAEARQVIGNLVGGEVSAGTPTTPDFLQLEPGREAAVRQFLTEPATRMLPLQAVHSLSVEELVKSFISPEAGPLPEGMDDIELLAMAKLMDIPADEIAEAGELSSMVAVYVEQANARSEAIASVLAGVTEWEIEQGFWEKALFTFLSPFQTFADVMRPYIENVSYPLAGVVTLAVQNLFSSEHDVEKEFDRLRSSGVNIWQAAGESWETWEAPMWQKLLIEIATDPITYTPGILLSAPGKVANKVGMKFLGSRLLALNKGMYEVLDIPFDMFKSALARFPKSFNQATKIKLNHLKDLVFTNTQKQSGKLLHMLTPDDIAKTLDGALIAYKKNPMAQNDLMADLGRELMETTPILKNDAAIWSRSLGGKLTPENINPNILTDANDVIRDTVAAIGNPVINAKRMAAVLMVEDTPQIIGRLVKDIARYVKRYSVNVDAAKAVGRTAKVSPVTQMVSSLEGSYRKIAQGIARSEYADGKTFHGIVLALQRHVDAVENNTWRMTLDRYLVKPTAEAYLGSMAYPLWNAFEGIFVSTLEGVVPRMAKYEAFERMFHGIPGVDARVMERAASDVAGMLREMPGGTGSRGYSRGGIVGAPPVSFLPGKVPEVIGSVFGKKIMTPKWIAGKDWFEWTGRKWIELSEVWGTGLRANYLMKKMASYLATEAVSSTGFDMTAAFTKLIGKPPAISSTRLGIKPEQLRQMLFEAVTTGNKKTVLALKEVFSNGSLIQDEQLKILRQATLGSPQAKTLMEQAIRENRVMGRAPKMVASAVNWEKVTFAPNIVSHKDKIIKMVDDLPVEFKAGVRSIGIDKSLATRKGFPVDAEFDFKTGRLLFSSEEKVSPDVLYHELAHASIWDMVAEGNYGIVLDAIEATGFKYDTVAFAARVKKGKLNPEQLAQLKAKGLSTQQLENAKFLGAFEKLPGGLQLIEDIAEGFSKYALGKKLPANLQKLFARYFPKKGKGADSIVDSVRTWADQSIADLAARETQLPDSFALLANQIAKEEVKSSGDLMQLTQHYLVMSENASNFPSAVMSKTFEEVDALRNVGKFKSVEKLWRTRREEMQRAIDSIDDSLESVRQKVLTNTKVLKPEQEQALTALLERQGTRDTLRNQYLVDDGRFLDDFFALSKAERTPEVYTEMRAYRAELYGRFRKDDAVIGASDFLARKDFANLYYKMPAPKLSPVDATGRALSSQDIAKVFGVNVDALATGITENTALQGREYFIQMVKQGAESNPTVFRGFTEAKISRAYDDILQSMHFDPAIDISRQKILQQAEGMKQRLIALRMLKSLTPNEEKAIHGWIDNIAKGMDNIFAKKPKVAQPKIMHLSTEEAGAQNLVLTQQGLTAAGRFKSVDAAMDAAAKVGKTVDDVTLVESRKAYDLYYKGTAGTPVPPVAAKGQVTPDEWQSIREKASHKAHRDYYKAFADYSNENIVDATMKMVFPYWTYHMYRWFFLPRTFIRHPGVAAAWGKYYDYSDYGYVHIPGTDLEINPFVGSAFGSTFGLARHDFKSYYENLGMLGEGLDFWQRRGFFPGIHFMLPVVLSPVLSGRPPELGDALPPLYRAGIEMLIGSDIPGVSESATWLRDKLFHENFRDYYTATIVSGLQVTAGGTLIEGQSGVDLWFKQQRGETLTEEEQSLWDEASNRTAWYSVLRSQFPLFRLREEEYLEAYQKITGIFEQQFGMSAEFQENLWKHNLKPTDVIGGLPLSTRTLLDEMWQWRIYTGRGAILMPPEISDLYNRINEYWDRVRDFQDTRITTSEPGRYISQTDIDTGFLSPTNELHFNGREWRSEHANTWQNYTAMVFALDTDPRFAEVIEATTPEGQVALAKELGFSPPTRHPLDEAIDLYFSIELERTAEEFTGEEEWNYLGFWLQREAIRMALTEEQRAEFDNYIRKFETPVEKLFRQVSDKYFRGYKAIPRILIEEYSDDQRALISEYYADGTSLTRKEEIRNAEGLAGKKLISGWESGLTVARAKIRYNSPMLDFWLYVFGYTTTSKTPAARSLIDSFEVDRSLILNYIQ